MKKSSTSEDWLEALNRYFGNIPKGNGRKHIGMRPIDEEGIWQLHIRGMSNRKIASLLHLSSRTVDRRLKYIADKKSGKEPKNLRDY